MSGDPEKNFESLWKTFNDRYPFFELRKVDWKQQYATYRPKVTADTLAGDLFEILCKMLEPLNDGHVELEARIGGKKRYFRPEKTPRFYREFTTKQEIRQLFENTGKTLAAHGFGRPAETEAWNLHYCKSADFCYLRVLELEGISKSKLRKALNKISRDFAGSMGFIIDIRNNPGGDDSIALAILGRFCDRKRVAFRRKTKMGRGENNFSPTKTWHLESEGSAQFTGPIVLLTCDSVFSGGEVFALAAKQLPYVTSIGDQTNGIFSYQLEKRLPNGWEYRLSYQVYLSADMVCYESKGVPPDIRLLNKKKNIKDGIDPLITRALKELRSNERK